MEIDRSEVSRALAKAIAYKNCGKDREAEAWARTLVELLQCSGILAKQPIKLNFYDAGSEFVERR